ncbi:MAG: agmatinase [Phycisphaerales bacterium]
MSRTPRTILPDARVSPRFAGIATFCRYPRLEDVLPEHRPVDWALFGVPFDGGVTFRPGARFGPRAIREASQYIKRYSPEHAVDVCEVLSIADAGDAPVSPYEIPATLELVSDFAAGIDEPDPAHAKLLAVGGDHSIAYANIRATYARRAEPAGGLGCIHFDSHLDTVDAVWGSRWGHASPFRRAIEEGLINPQKMVSIGIKGQLNSPADLEFAQSRGVTIISQTDLTSGAGQTTLAEFVRRLAGMETYLSFDIDVVDPAFAPGTGTPACGGLTSAEALALLRMLQGVNLVGADVVEVLPDRDPAGITALLAATVMFEILALDAARRKAV